MNDTLCRALVVHLFLLVKSGGVVEAWSSSSPKSNNSLEHAAATRTKVEVKASSSIITTRKEFWRQVGATTLGALGILSVSSPDSAVAAPPKKIPYYIQERGSLEKVPGQPAKKSCWSTEDTQGRRVQRWEVPAAIQGKPNEIAEELEDVMAAYPQEGQNDGDRGGWIPADRQQQQLDSSNKNNGKATYLRYEYTSGKFKYIDELELLVDDQGKVSVRTASRSAGFDCGVNGARLNFIQKALQSKGWKVKLV